MTQPVSKPSAETQTIRVRRRERAYLERRRIGPREYFLLEPVGSPFHRRHLAFDPRCGPAGDFFLVETVPADAANSQRLPVLRRLRDDHFPRVWEWQRRGKNVDVVLSWIEGVSLADYLSHLRSGRRPPLDPGQALRLASGLAEAVCRLNHKLQIAHGDIQTANIILTNQTSRLVLIDFGSAWTKQAAAFRDEGDGHHRCYAAPELQTEHSPAGFFADQFSVSAILYELLTLQLPYGGLGGKAGRSEFIQQAEQSLVPPSQLSCSYRDLPRSLRDLLDAVTLRGLALDPEERYPDRHAWTAALFEASARFRLAPEPSRIEKALTWVVDRFGNRSSGNS